MDPDETAQKLLNQGSALIAAERMPDDHEIEEEYVFLDLDAVSRIIDIPPNAPYFLSGMDTLNPVLVIDNKWKLIGHYEETIGSCIIFKESETSPVVHEETGPSEENLFTGRGIINPHQAPKKEVKPIASLMKVLKFKLSPDAAIGGPNSQTDVSQ